MNQGPGNRKRRPRSQGNKRNPENQSAAEHQAAAAHDLEEDASTFWERSNARLNIDPADANPVKRNAKIGGEYACAACGTVAFYERTPKHRHEVVCDACRQALGGLITGGEREAATQLRRAMNPNRNRKNEGIPAFDAEDLEALAEVKARNELGSGRNANRRKGNGPLFSTGAGGLRTASGGGGGGGGRGKGNGRGKSGDGQKGQRRKRPEGGEGGGNPQGGGRRRKGGGKGERPAAPQGSNPPRPASPEGGGDAEARKRRRRRRRRPGEGGGEGNRAAD